MASRTIYDPLTRDFIRIPQQNVVAEMVGQKIGGTTDYASFDANGNLTFSGNAGMARRVGYKDIFPFDSGGDGTNAAAFTLITGRRFAYEFPGTGALKQRFYKYHIDHDIVLNPTEYHIHLHWEHNSTNPTGNAIFTVYFMSALRDGTFSAEAILTITLTPSNANKNSNMVTEVAITEQISNLKTDSIYTVYVSRDPANVGDTFTGSIWAHGCDIHAQHDSTLTTSKDPGTGWNKVSV